MDTNKMDWFREARYGMFIHWGLYAIPGGEWNGVPSPFGAEWLMRNLQVPLADYKQLAARFNPVDFDARRWVADLVGCGMKYLVFTAKHHDGFCMYHSRVSPYNIVDATPFGRDVVAELAEACREAGIVFGLYYSQFQDWEDPDAHGNSWDFPDEAGKDFERYFENKALPQVRELLENYGEIGVIWFDTPYEMPKHYCERLRDLVRELQPDCLINGRIGYKLGDYQQMGDNGIPVTRYPGDWETPMTLNDTWGYCGHDHNWKPASTVFRMLVDICQRGGNFLINVGPDARGLFPGEGMASLRPVGEWLEHNGASIYGSTPAPDFPYQLGWGGFTFRGGTLYMHVLRWPPFPFEICVVGLVTRVLSGKLLHDGTPVKVIQSYETARDEYRLRVQLPELPPHPYDTVVALELEAPPEIHHA